ncbi:GNAT family N-acetyltransferase [Lactococcus cremoris]|nr:GNAT family N-acetyltransferase [Lactococcus cremoris]
MTKLDIYSDKKYELAVKNYLLSDTSHTGSAQSMVERCKMDSEKFQIVILNDENKLVGCFILDIGLGPRQYGFLDGDVALLRAFSIDDRFRRQGYASTALDKLSNFVHQYISNNLSRIVLAVNEENIAAQKTYEKSGFKKTLQTSEGKLGLLFIMEKEI